MITDQQERLRADVDALADDLAFSLPFLIGTASRATMAAVRGALQRLPLGVLRSLAACKATIAMEPFAYLVHGDGTRVGGLATPYPPSARVAAARKPEEVVETVLHEVGHVWDHRRASWGRGPQCCISGSVRWRHVWQKELAAGNVFGLDARLDPAEHFADCFAAYFGSDRVRATLSPAVRRFLAELFFP